MLGNLLAGTKEAPGKEVIINGDGTQQRDFLYVGDVAQANILALTRGDNGIYNLGTGIPVDVNTIYRKLKELTGYTSEATHGPRKKGEVYRIYLDASKARAALGWEPKVSLDEGLRITVDYFKENPLT
jgi:UDP-glucose 4-epimerase